VAGPIRANAPVPGTNWPLSDPSRLRRRRGGHWEPKVWADLYTVSEVRPRDPEHLIREMDCSYPLQMEPQRCAESRYEEPEIEFGQMGG
jgi:hypothetical protein